MVFQRVLFFSAIIACEVLHSKGAGGRILGQAINTKTYHLGQDQFSEFPFTHFIQAKRNRRDASSSVEEDNENIAHENNDTTQHSENQSHDANEEEEKNEPRLKQRICNGLPLCGRKNGDRRRQKRLTENITNNNLKRGIDLLMNLERYRHKQQVDAYARNLVDLEGIKGNNVNQLNEEVKPNQANCVGWFRRRASSSTTSSSVDAAGTAADGGDGDSGGDADDSNLQTSRRLRARRRTTTHRSRHN